MYISKMGSFSFKFTLQVSESNSSSALWTIASNLPPQTDKTSDLAKKSQKLTISNNFCGRQSNMLGIFCEKH